MRYSTALLTCFFLLVPSLRADEPTPEKQRAALQGKWVAKEQFTDGKPVPKDEWIQLAWEFKDDKATITLADFKGRSQSPLKYSFSIDPSKKPSHIDLTGSNPKIGFIGLYKLDGDTLTICWNAGRETRPAELKTSKSDFYWMLVLKRDK